MGLLIAALAAAACSPTPVIPVTGVDTSSNEVILAQQQATINAIETELAVTPSVPATPTPPPTPLPSQTPENTLTPTITATPPLTPTPSVPPVPTQTYTPTSIYAANDCNLAEFVTDLTIPDGTVINAGTSFVKSWRLRNVGSCTWTPDYEIVSVGDNPLGGPAYSRLGISIAPGKTIDLALRLVAPAAGGDYSATYRLANASGGLFGVGAGGGESFGVHIVDIALPPFAVTHADLSVNTSVASAICPPGYTFIFNANIVANGPGNVIYHWIFSDGTTTAQQTLSFSAAGTQTVSAFWALGISGTLPSNPFAGTASIYIDAPNHQTFGAQPIAIGCIFPTATP